MIYPLFIISFNLVSYATLPIGYGKTIFTDVYVFVTI